MASNTAPVRPCYYPPPSHSSSSASLKGCCCWLFLFFSFLGLLVLAVVLLIVLAVKPKKPQFDLERVSVQYLGVTPQLGAALVSFNIRMVFTAVNGNKVGIKYDQSRFTVIYRGVTLGRGTVPGFYQPAHSVKHVATTVAVDRVNILQADAADLVRDASLNDRVELKILGDVGAKIIIIGITSPGVQGESSPHNHFNWIQGLLVLQLVQVDCAIVISPRKQCLSYKQCGFDGLNV